jgi:biopolymer transport protein ExbB/TolQ
MLGGPEKAEALKFAKRASPRSAAVVHGELKRGLNSLATIASTAQWVGLFGTILGIYNSFGGVNGTKTSIMAYYFDGLSQAFVPCAFGLVVALVAMWCYKYLLAEVEVFDAEMEGASLQLINDLGRLESN